MLKISSILSSMLSIRTGIIVSILFCSQLHADDWMQFRGPSGDGHSPKDSNLPITWGGFFEKPVWKVNIPGRGWSSPIVVGNRVWVTSSEHVALSESDAEEKLAARPFGMTDFQTHASVTLFAIELDADTGEILRRIDLFQRDNPPPIHSTNSYASPTPVSDGTCVYCHFGSLGTCCIRIVDGVVIWKKRFEIEEITGNATSPVLEGSKLFLALDGTDHQYVIALDKQTGATSWQTQRPETEAVDIAHLRSFSTPLIVEFEGRKQLIAPAAQWLVSYDPDSGEEWWRAKIGTGHALVPRAVYHDGKVVVCTGYPKPQMVAVKIDGSGDVSTQKIVWKSLKQIPEIASPIVVGDEIFFVTVGGVATCLDVKTGAMHWQHRLKGNFAASPTYSDGRVYFTSKEGVTTVIGANKTFNEIAVNELFGETMASLAVYRDAFLVRTDPTLYCIKQEKIE